MKVGELRRILDQVDDDYTIDMRVRRRMTDDELSKMAYPFPFITVYTELEFDDIGVSDKQLCLGCEIDRI